MAFSSVSVVTNSLRLRKKKLSEHEKATTDKKPATPVDERINEKDEESIINNQPIKEEKSMKRTLKVSGMMCNHCRMHVEKALNKLEGVSATVTLNPPVATIEFTGDQEYTLDELQKQVSEEAGEYTLSE